MKTLTFNYTKEELEDLLLILGTVDPYYIPYLSESDKLYTSFMTELENKLKEYKEEMLSVSILMEERKCPNCINKELISHYKNAGDLEWGTYFCVECGFEFEAKYNDLLKKWEVRYEKDDMGTS